MVVSWSCGWEWFSDECCLRCTLGAEETFAVVQEFLLAVGFNCVLREDCAGCVLILISWSLEDQVCDLIWDVDGRMS